MPNTSSATESPDRIVFPPFTSPFEHIALAFSGGGFRAASFALGVLSYLNEVTFDDHTAEEEQKNTSLLKKVTYLSSASGGTITASLYTLHHAAGGTFLQFYAQLLTALKGDDLLLKALHVLNDAQPWEERKLKKRNLINAFAITYDKHLFGGKTIADLHPKEGVRGHLEEVCFNATEMYRGIVFRQQVKLKKEGPAFPWFLYGNFTLSLHPRKSALLKLGDVLAASSCFPAGFEPILFPDDFMYGDHLPESFVRELNIRLQSGSLDELQYICGKDQSPEDLKYNRDVLLGNKKGELKFCTPLRIGLMDGGITDNQGLESLMYANQRRIRNSTGFKPFDLMLINDVGSHYMDAYTVPKEEKGSVVTRRGLTFFRILFVILTLGGGVLIGKYYHTQPVGVIVGSMLVTLAMSAGFVLWFLRRKLTRVRHAQSEGFNLAGNFSRPIINKLLAFLGRTPVRVLTQMIRERLSSVMTLNNDVFLKRIRYLLYSKFYEMPDWRIRGKANHVYDLSLTNNLNRLSRKRREDLDPSPIMQKVAEHAFSMGTTLWFENRDFSENHRLAGLIACGHFTTCFNLLEYICTLREHTAWNTLDAAYQKRVNQIEEKLRKDYENLKKDPFFFYNTLGASVKDFQPVKPEDVPEPKNFSGLV